MGPDVETYFQEVLATLEQSAEESGRGERGTLRSRLQQLYSEIADAGRTSLLWKGMQLKKATHAFLMHSCSVLDMTQVQTYGREKTIRTAVTSSNETGWNQVIE